MDPDCKEEIIISNSAGGQKAGGAEEEGEGEEEGGGEEHQEEEEGECPTLYILFPVFTKRYHVKNFFAYYVWWNRFSFYFTEPQIFLVFYILASII